MMPPPPPPPRPATVLHLPPCEARRGDVIVARLGWETAEAEVLAVAWTDGTLQVRPVAGGATVLIPPGAAIRVLVPAADRRAAP